MSIEGGLEQFERMGRNGFCLGLFDLVKTEVEIVIQLALLCSCTALLIHCGISIVVLCEFTHCRCDWGCNLA